jgi:hypothetical protein
MLEPCLKYINLAKSTQFLLFKAKPFILSSACCVSLEELSKGHFSVSKSPEPSITAKGTTHRKPEVHIECNQQAFHYPLIGLPRPPCPFFAIPSSCSTDK